MGLNKRLFPAAAAAVADYTTGLTSHVQIGTSTLNASTIYDLSGNSQNYTIGGGYIIQSNYLSMSANSGWVYTNLALSPNTNFSLVYWYNMSLSTSYAFLLGAYSSSGVSYLTVGNVTGSYTNESFGTYNDYVSTDFDYFPLNGHYAYSDGTWRMFGATNAGGAGLTFYMNGQQVGYSAGSSWGTRALSTARYDVATNPVTPNYGFGMMRTYDHVVAATDMDAIFQATRSIYGL